MASALTMGAALAADQTWTVSGTIQVEESTTTGSTQIRPLKGVEVEVLGANVGRIYGSWGTVHTDSSGKFTLKNVKNKDKRHFKVKVRLQDKEKMLAVNTAFLSNPFASEWNDVFETSSTTDGPSVSVGTKTFKVSAGGELGGDRARRAMIYYVAKSAMDSLKNQGGGLEYTHSIQFAYPAKLISSSYANGVTWTAYIMGTDKGDHANAPSVLHEMMHLWNYQHNHGTSNWLDAVWGDQNTHSFQEEANIAFHEGFAEWASNEWQSELWASSRVLPANRKSLSDNKLINLKTLERNDDGVMHGLHLLTTSNIFGWSFGTRTTAPSGAKDTGGHGSFSSAAETDRNRYAESPRIGFFDVLKVFLPHSSKGFPNSWEVGDKNNGLVAFFDRASAILGSSNGFSSGNKQMYLDLLSTEKTKEPKDYLK